MLSTWGPQGASSRLGGGEHRRISIRTNNPLQSPPFSAIREHSTATNHSFNHNNFKIIATTNQLDSHILESLHIKQLKPSLNTGSPIDLCITP